MLVRKQLRWVGHVFRMPEHRLSRQILYGQLSEARRNPGGQKKRYKDQIKTTMKKSNIVPMELETNASDSKRWRTLCSEGCSHLEEARNLAREERRRRRHYRNGALPANAALTCQQCGKVPAAPIQTTCTNQDPCKVSCEGCTGLTTIPDPLDCRRFFYCNEDELLADEPFSCPDGQVYNSATHECEVDPAWLDCSPPCQPKPGECRYTCLPGYAYTASVYDCSTYHSCDAEGNSGVAHSCPPEAPYFDGTKCQTDEKLCCHCHGYCFPGDEGRLVADPKDCRKYHVCLAEGVPAASGDCGKEMNFDRFTRQCSAEAPCRSVCRNVVNADGYVDPFICLEAGDFAYSTTECIPEYYHCSQALCDTYQETTICRYSYEVFDPVLRDCVRPEDCTV